ncbi:Peptidase S33 tripeptidyl aminopeptidase-lik [Metarhizium album ARSEF 1941]|uniref:Peptidase S33 tripeptidyl aminopeptidase-lik n=1 Tax=Metarhizium album (strain ARSEF 1941) TaxID=1081103 RepID=A0A0B2X337_METAS|nr:Peptidase S33 tripeptidyl aminopeptidase-lik [Metarhizium album ARSEF 1941]KHN99715.1 Peptidase S33 tripeptidyl aminopeptidase-lik [Metarhizium album ARSEF 1941]
MRPRDELVIGLFALAAANASDTPAFDWDSISPSTDLRYHDCYTSGFKCARLELPLSWKNSTDPRTVPVAIVKLAAKVPDDDPTFGGTIFTNPGGPGGSGVDLVVTRGHYLRDYVDSPGRKHFEIVSFDPRGVGNSRPLANCFPHAPLARDAWMLEMRGNGGLDKSPAAISYGLALFDAYGRTCEKADARDLNGGEIFRYLGTPSVARDMVAMVDSIDHLRRTEAARQGRTELRKRDKEDVPRLQYIGFSYGTILGNYFASLFPGRIGRLVLDGVCNADDYANGAVSLPHPDSFLTLLSIEPTSTNELWVQGWLTNTVDSDTIIDKFFEGCFHAGPKVCALARPKDISATDVSGRFWPWLKQLDEAPVAGVGPSGGSIILTGGDIRRLLALAAYVPITSFVQAAQLLDDAMVHEAYDPILAVVESELGGPLQDACPVGNNQTARRDQGPDTQTAVLCVDGEDIRGKKTSWWSRYVQKQIAQSAVFGAFWSTIRFPCSGWRFRPNWDFHGPFTSPEAPRDGGKPRQGQPAAPLMFLTNRLDPVTPLAAARAMARNHPGARVVVQEAMGHCATFSAYSECTRGIVAEYFDTGKVPDREEVCEAECGPWDDGCGRVLLKSDLAEKEAWFARRYPLGV